MKKKSSYKLFDLSKVKTYPLKVRGNKVDMSGFVDVKALQKSEVRYSTQPWFRNGLKGPGTDQSTGLIELAKYIVKCRRENKPVIVMSGAHPIKNGLNPIVIDLIERGVITLYSTNGAGTIHSFELALTGASSESVRDALPKGEFGMAFETGMYINYALKLGVQRGYGYGESMGRLYCDAAFRKDVIDRVFKDYPDTGDYFKPYDGFKYADSCVFAAAYKKGIPACVHAMLGTDIIDQQPSFDGAAKGAASGTDFLVFTEEICKFTGGGVVLNVGTAIMGPEVLLKAVSMAANVGKKPNGLWTADFDVRPFVFDDDKRDESLYYYYLRDQKSVATRIPKVFGGVGFYFQSLHQDTLPPLYQLIIREMGK
jgi:hypothetical protein